MIGDITHGWEIFGQLRAEDEPWLEDCFVEPNGFQQLLGDQSTVIFGGAGCGKTALYRELQTRSRMSDGRPTRLTIHWRPQPIGPDVALDSAWVQRQAAQVLDECAMVVAEYVSQNAADYSRAPRFAQDRLVWFIHCFAQRGPYIRLGRLLERGTVGADQLRNIVDTVPKPILREDAGKDQVIAELASALETLSIDGIWVMADGLEGWTEADDANMLGALQSLLSLLALFERSRLAFKLFVPARWEPMLSRASGILRRRVQMHRIEWETAQLVALCEARLRLATGGELKSLGSLCKAPTLPKWLETVGAGSPREWLDQLLPLVKRYISHQLTDPIDEVTWRRLRLDHPPRFVLDEDSRRVLVGGRDISLSDIPAKAFEMLKYLYRHGGQLVTEAELYYLGYRGLATVPRTTADDHYEAPKDYEGLIDTNLWRLRKAIEAEPRHPAILRTVRGYGVRLSVRW